MVLFWAFWQMPALCCPQPCPGTGPPLFSKSLLPCPSPAQRSPSHHRLLFSVGDLTVHSDAWHSVTPRAPPQAGHTCLPVSCIPCTCTFQGGLLGIAATDSLTQGSCGLGFVSLCRCPECDGWPQGSRCPGVCGRDLRCMAAHCTVTQQCASGHCLPQHLEFPHVDFCGFVTLR